MDTQQIVKVSDVLYLRHNVPDLHEMELFRIDFGMVWAANDNETLCMSGTGTDACGHITSIGPIATRSMSALQRACCPISGAQATHRGPDMPPSLG